ncbi:MAG: fibronectin type III domain-containing protein [Candidatus Absconditabacterales bacterium]|nr:fibronectin type III domain-containing protein [Candidatus Absconditabacterales bacterium]
MRKKTFLTALIILSSITTLVTARIARFDVQVNPSTFNINETVDMTIRALDANGDVFKEYNGMVIMEFSQFLNPDQYDIPSDGIYTFQPQDLGVKTFSKGLRLKEGGTYTINVFDINDETIMGSTTIIVGEREDDDLVKKNAIVDIISPLSGEQINSTSFALLGRSEIIRSPIQIFLNGNQVPIETQSDENGNFSAFMRGLNSGQNEVFVRVVNINNQVLAESNVVRFVARQGINDGTLNSITITPSPTMNAGDKTTYTIQVGNGVANAELKIGDVGVFPLDRASPTSFSKVIAIDKPGIHGLSINLLTNDGERKIYNNIEFIEVKEPPKPVAITNLRVVRSTIDSTSAQLSWENAGSVSGYLIMRGPTQDSMTNSGFSTGTSFTVTNLGTGQTSFFQVFGVDNSNTPLGTPSNIVASNFEQQGSAPVLGGTCVVSNVGSRTEKVGNQHFLIWDPVPNATAYIISKIDANGAKQVVAEVTQPRYQYPFDPTLETATFETFSIEARCSDGQTLMVHGAARVNVGPKENILIILIISLICYGFYYRKRTYI